MMIKVVTVIQLWSVRNSHWCKLWYICCIYYTPCGAWWRHQMETFSALLALCAGNSPVTAEFPSQRPVTRSLDVYFDLRLNKRLSKQSWDWWFETLSQSLCSYCYELPASKNVLSPGLQLNVQQRPITRDAKSVFKYEMKNIGLGEAYAIVIALTSLRTRV